MANAWQDFLIRLTQLNVNKSGGRVSPHKPVLLLAVLDMAQAGRLSRNRITADPPLLERYRMLFDAVAGPNQQPNPFLPLFHMRSEPFWELSPVLGREAIVPAMPTVKGMADFRRNVEYAYLDPAVHQALAHPEAIEEAAQIIINHWFPERRGDVEEAWRFNRQVSQYELILDEQTAPEAAVADFVPARSAAFRRLVLDAYDYRCAASGWRFILDDWYLVEAAHIKPFTYSHDDRPQNGIALSPTFHRLMDRNIIAPGPDYCWHVSDVVDARIPDNRSILEIEGTRLLLPSNEKDCPEQAALEWRQNQLRLG